MNQAWRVRAAAGLVSVAAAVLAYAFRETLSGRLRAGLGIVAFLAIVVACSSNVLAVRWRTVAWGLGLQLVLALFILKVSVAGVRPGYETFAAVAALATRFLDFTNAGSTFVFGVLADPVAMGEVFPNGLVLAFSTLPVIIFASAVFTVLYHLGVLQVGVRLMARVMMPLMGTSGAETLAAAANVFMGQTEAPIIVRPYIPAMTRSELLALMTGGLATIAGSMFVVYVNLGADPVAMLTTGVMAAPCGLYLAKILLPETETPVTAGRAHVDVERSHVNVIDAAAGGAADGMRLAINVAAVLIAFLALVAMIDHGLGLIRPGLSLAGIFAIVFAPVAALIGVPAADVPLVADLLGTKLVATEFVAYLRLTGDYAGIISERGHVLATYALTGFANLGSIGILLGGIGGMAPERRGDLARLGSRALLAGFAATLINASIAAILI